jgi:RND family efflux transporter MFP subunit
MRRILTLLIVVLALAAAGYVVYTRTSGTASPPAGAGGTAGRGGPGGMGGGAFGRPPMTVELASVTRAPVAEQITVVGNLVGAATVEVVSKVAGRLQAVNVRIGDRVSQGTVIAQVEDREVREQVKQAEASYQVAQATIRQREADLKFAESNLDRSRSLYDRQLLPRQTLDDSEARQQAAIAQLDLARAQFEQAKARLEELRITLANTRVYSPVDGFVGRRNVDPGAYVSTNVVVASVVDIKFVRLVAPLVEKDMRRVLTGAPAVVDVDAFPGETFKGRVARVAPVLDPATRTATMEIEVPNQDYRLKPGMYARVRLTVAERPNALVVPRNALVDIDGKRGVFMIDGSGKAAQFRPIEVGLQDDRRAEVLAGLTEAEKVITTGAAAVREGDPVVLAGQGGRPGGGPGGAPRGAGQGGPAGGSVPQSAAPGPGSRAATAGR